MRFLVDECTGPAVARWLRDEQEHEVFSVFDEARGATDDKLIAKAFAEKWILITNDKDFGEKVFKTQQPHCGIVFLRLENERATNKIKVLRSLLNAYGEQLANQYVVVTEKRIRFVGGTPVKERQDDSP